MTLNKRALFLLRIFMVFAAFFIVSGCANIQRPRGGPRDVTPPKLLKATPLNPTKNFSAKIIQLDFDEYFTLSNEYQEITMSPTMEKPPEYSIRSKSLFIKLKDTLAKNTTYVINFGKAIADVNEHNILKNFTYVFSTGPKIDSLSISGNVINPYTQVKEKDITVMLIPARQDTIWGKHKPAIYTTTDSSGNFHLGNLHGGDYKLYALQEKVPNKVYDNDDEFVAFLKNTIHLTKDTSNIHLRLFKQIPAKLKTLDRRIDQDGKLIVIFNKGIPNASVKIQDPVIDAEKTVTMSKEGDSTLIYLPNMAFDSVKVSFLSNGKPLDTLAFRKRKADTYRRNLVLKYNLSFEDHLKPGSDLMMTTNYPITSVDQTRIILLEDSVDVGEQRLLRNANDPNIFTLKYAWKPGKAYAISFNIGTFTDVYGDRNAALKKRFQLDKPENYGTLNIKIHLPDSDKNNYLVQLLSESGAELRSDMITHTQVVSYKDFPTSKYKIRVIYDANRNGKWDTGNIKQNIYPENAWYFDKSLILRPNFDDVNQDIIVPKEPDL